MTTCQICNFLEQSWSSKNAAVDAMEVVAILASKLIDFITVLFRWFKAFWFFMIWQSASVLGEPYKLVFLVKDLIGAVFYWFHSFLKDFISCSEHFNLLFISKTLFRFGNVILSPTWRAPDSTLMHRKFLIYGVIQTKYQKLFFIQNKFIIAMVWSKNFFANSPLLGPLLFTWLTNTIIFSNCLLLIFMIVLNVYGRNLNLNKIGTSSEN